MARLSLEAQLDTLETMSTAELKAQWPRVYTCPPPHTRGLLLLALAFDLQSKATGKMSASTLDVLRSAEYGPSRSTPVPTGARLMRSWNGQTYVVETAEDGTIRWNNREWRSLSEVARAIVEQIIAGRQPAKLDARKLTLSGELPMRWNRQRTFAGFSTTR